MLTPAEIFASMPDLEHQFRALKEDPGAVATLDQFQAAHDDVFSRMREDHLVEGGFIKYARGPGASHARLVAWLRGARHQAQQRGLARRKCPHVFRVAALAYLYVGRGVAACEACVAAYIGRYHGTRPDDLRCEVCGEEQPPDAVFTQLVVPNGGVIVIVDACVSCTEWLARAFGVET